MRKTSTRRPKSPKPDSKAPPNRPYVVPTLEGQFTASLDFIAQGIGGREAFLRACSLSDNPLSQTFLSHYYALSPADQASSLNDLCTRASIKPQELLGDVLSTVVSRHNELALLISALNRPQVMMASVAAALTEHGIEDRKIQLEVGGIVRSPGSTTVNILNQLSQSAKVEGLPSFEEDSTQSVRSVQSQGDEREIAKALPPATPTFLDEIQSSAPQADPLEAPIVRSHKNG